MKTALRIFGGCTILVVLVCICLVGGLAASGVDLALDDGDIVIDSTFSITEEQMNSGDNSAFNFAGTEFIRNAEYDVRDGEVAISGDMLCEDESRADGQLIVRMELTDDNFIDVEITDVTAECEIDQALVDRAQTDLANDLDEAARDFEASDVNVTFNEISVENDTVTISLEIRIPFF